jgi:hypothetical protein
MRLSVVEVAMRLAHPRPGMNSSAIVAGLLNTVTGPNSFIGAGYNNTVASSSSEINFGPSSSIGAGAYN